MPKQVTVFVDNRPGRIEHIAEVFKNEKINIRAMTIQDTGEGESGIIKILVDKPEQAHLTLVDRGFACVLKDVLAIVLEDNPGELFRLTKFLAEHDINISDAYGFMAAKACKGVFCICVKEPEKISQSLLENGFEVLSDEELYLF